MKITTVITINRTIFEVFDFLVDNFVENYSKIAPLVVKVEQVPIGVIKVGTQFFITSHTQSPKFV